MAASTLPPAEQASAGGAKPNHANATSAAAATAVATEVHGDVTPCATSTAAAAANEISDMRKGFTRNFLDTLSE